MNKCVLCKKVKVKGVGPFFKVPQEPRRLENWRRACGVTLTTNNLVCVDHFGPTDLICGGQRTHLMPNAVPTTYTCEQALDSCLPIIENTSSEVEKIFTTSEVGKSKTYVDNWTQTEPILIQCARDLELEDLKARYKQLLEENNMRKMSEMKSSALMTSVNAIFTEGQVRKMILNNKTVEWSWRDISNAICIHAAGPRAFRHLYEKGFPLPHVTTLQRWYRKVDIKEGTITVALDLMRELSDLTAVEKLMVLAFDEMKVTETFEYEAMGDYVRKPANYVQVVMARGLWKSWKQPVFFDFDCKITVDILNNIVLALHDAGFPVVAMVCDMGTSNQKLWRELGVTISQPWFANPTTAEEKIFAFADAPHLLKLIRNHFIDTGFVRNAKSDLTITYKMTEEHLSVKGLGRQKVKLAAQLMSNTTANAILYCYSLGNNVCEPVETAKLIQLVNDWFDVLNSSVDTFSYPGKEPFGLQLEKQNKVLEDMNGLMSEVIIPGKRSIQQFQKAVLVSNNALRMLYEYVVERYNFQYIATRRLNQDVLEHFFGNMRAKGGLYDHPSPKEFKFRLRKYILARNSEILQNTGNVEQDSTEWLNTSNPQMLCNTERHEQSVLQEPDVEEQEMVEALSGPNMENSDRESDILEDAAVEYIAGYIIRKQNLTQHEDTTNTNFSWIHQASKGFLKKPSTRFVENIRLLENTFNAVNFDQITHCRNIKQRLVDNSAHVNLPDDVKRFFYKCRIFFRIRRLNKQLKIKKAKDRLLRYKKLVKVTQ